MTSATLRLGMGALVTSLLLACQNGEATTADSGTALSVSSTRLDLISPATCQRVGTRLRQCVIPSTLLLPLPIDHAVPTRVTVRTVVNGNCSTQYPLEVTLAAPEYQEAVRFGFLQARELRLRASEGQPVTEVSLADASPWTAIASFDPSCAIHLEVVLNEPDVDTRRQAEAAMAEIDLELQAATQRMDTLRHLLLFHGAYEFLNALAGSLHTELSNDMMQQLRELHAGAREAFDELYASEACVQALGSSVDHILDVADALFILGDASDWQNPDGTTMTLAEMYSEFRGDGIVAQIQELAAQANPSLIEQYNAQYTDAAIAVELLRNKQILAAVQLAPWLEQPESGVRHGAQ
jgi:hypothetical protein